MPPLSSQPDHPTLHTFLDRPETGETGLTVAYMEGFLTAAAAGPPWTTLQDFLDAFFGEEPPAFTDTEEAQTVIGDILERHNELVAVFDADPGAFAPNFREEELEAWATGFARAMEMVPDGWDSLMDDDQAVRLLMPILSFARLETETQPIIDQFKDSTPERRRELAGYIPETVGLIAAYFRDVDPDDGKLGHRLQPANVNTPHRARKVGRNEPCICGSGKKYKKCCGR